MTHSVTIARTAASGIVNRLRFPGTTDDLPPAPCFDVISRRCLVTAAQDVMELDLAFKNGRLGSHASEVRPERRDPGANGVATKKSGRGGDGRTTPW